jgi:hypothetical protein
MPEFGETPSPEFAADKKMRDEFKRWIWTTEQPTEPGWYWARSAKGVPYIVQVGLFGSGESGTLWVYMTHYSKAFDLDIVDYWLGPLPVPELPK